MEYKSHRILKSGHIELRETDGDKTHYPVIAPNEPLDRYNDIIEADKNWKYRTQENADAYESRLAESVPSDEQIQAQKEREAEQEARQIAIEELIAERTQTALDNVKSEIALGNVEDARKAVRDEHKKLKG